MADLRDVVLLEFLLRQIMPSEVLAEVVEEFLTSVHLQQAYVLLIVLLLVKADVQEQQRLLIVKTVLQGVQVVHLALDRISLGVVKEVLGVEMLFVAQLSKQQ